MKSGRFFKVYICLSATLCISIPLGLCKPTTVSSNTTTEHFDYRVDFDSEDFLEEQELVNEGTVNDKTDEDARWGLIYDITSSLKEKQERMTNLSYQDPCDQEKNFFYIDIFEKVQNLDKELSSIFHKMRTLEVINEILADHEDWAKTQLCDIESDMVCSKGKCACMVESMIAVDSFETIKNEEDGKSENKTTTKCVFDKDEPCTSDNEDCIDGYTCAHECYKGVFVSCSIGVISRFCDNYYEGKDITFTPVNLEANELYFTEGMKNLECCKCLPNAVISEDKLKCVMGDYDKSNSGQIILDVPLMICTAVCVIFHLLNIY